MCPIVSQKYISVSYSGKITWTRGGVGGLLVSVAKQGCEGRLVYSGAGG